MTGHLVFSTLHTQSAVSTVSRLLDMGAQGYLIASALDGVLAQRLVRRICDNCAQPVEADRAAAELAVALLERRPRSTRAKFVEGAGCTYCNMTGYRGRIGIYELLEVDGAHRRRDPAQRLGASSSGSRRARRASCRSSSARSSYALDGTTSVAEVMTLAGGARGAARGARPCSTTC